MTVFKSKQELADALSGVLGDEPAAIQLAGLARPCVWLQTRAAQDAAPLGSTRLGHTKLGGLPDLPAGASWPMRPAYPDAAQRGQYPRASERPHAGRLLTAFALNFLAQINFAQIWAAGPVDEDIPRTGLLSIFYNITDKPWGAVPADALALQLYFQERVPSDLQRLPLPETLQALPAHWHLGELECALHTALTPLPVASADWKVHAARFSREQQDAYADWLSDAADCNASADGQDWRCHHVGGWPTPIQGDMQTRCALVAGGLDSGMAEHWCDPATRPLRDTATEWLLLLQIGTDEQAGFNWGDEGQLYLWIRREDLRARRFDQARLVLQCY